jgi:AcrR family transcriptional regulator
MSSTLSHEAPRRRLTGRQAESAEALVDAAEAEVEVSGYDGLSVRSAARRAGIAPATAYTYVSSKDHLLAELLWRRLAAVEETHLDPTSSLTERLGIEVAALNQITEGSPAVLAACTQALLNASVDVTALRIRIGAEVHRRLATACGPDAAEVADVLVTTYFGALISAGMGHLSYDEVPSLVVRAARLMTVGENR